MMKLTCMRHAYSVVVDYTQSFPLHRLHHKYPDVVYTFLDVYLIHKCVIHTYAYMQTHIDVLFVKENADSVDICSSYTHTYKMYTHALQRLRDEYADAVDKYFTSYNETTASAYDRTMYHQIAVDRELHTHTHTHTYEFMFVSD